MTELVISLGGLTFLLVLSWSIMATSRAMVPRHRCGVCGLDPIDPAHQLATCQAAA